jgi:hypothetical protein
MVSSNCPIRIANGSATAVGVGRSSRPLSRKFHQEATMAGRAPAFSFAQFKEVYTEPVDGGRDLTYEEIRNRLGGRGSQGLIASYKSRLKSERAELPDSAKIPEDLASQIRNGLITLHSTIKAQAEASLRVAHEVQADELMKMAVEQEESAEAHHLELASAKDAENRAALKLEDRTAEVQLLRQELSTARDELRRLDVQFNVSLSERNDARADASRKGALLEEERAVSVAANQALAVLEERAKANADQLRTLRLDCERLAKFEQAAQAVEGLRAHLQLLQEKIDLMVQTDHENRETIIRLAADNKILQRERDEFHGRADEAQKMHLLNLGDRAAVRSLQPDFNHR